MSIDEAFDRWIVEQDSWSSSTAFRAGASWQAKRCERLVKAAERTVAAYYQMEVGTMRHEVEELRAALDEAKGEQ